MSLVNNIKDIALYSYLLGSKSDAIEYMQRKKSNELKLIKLAEDYPEKYKPVLEEYRKGEESLSITNLLMVAAVGFFGTLFLVYCGVQFILWLAE